MPRLVSALLFAGCIAAISGESTATRFDVATVRKNKTKACSGRWDFRTEHGTVTAENAPLLRIISRAYGLTDDRISGPSWLDSECYDIHAKAGPGTPESELMPMLVALLQERLHMVARHEEDQRPFLRLVVDAGGTKLRNYGEAAPATPMNTDRRVVFMARHMPDLCERLGKVTGRPVVDKTGLTGDYMIVLSYLPLGLNGSEDGGSDIVTAVREQLGLRLEQQRGLVDIVKVLGIDKLPTRN